MVAWHERPVLQVFWLEGVHLCLGEPVVPLADAGMEIQDGVFLCTITRLIHLQQSWDGHVNIDIEHLELVIMPTNKTAITRLQNTGRSLERHIE